MFRACMILVGCPPGSRPPRQSSVFTVYSWKGGAIVAHVAPSLPSQHQLEMMLATPKSVGLPLSQIWKGGERASHVSMFSFLILETETSFRFLFWKRKPVSMMSFLILETETSFRFLFWKRKPVSMMCLQRCPFFHFNYESTHILT